MNLKHEDFHGFFLFHGEAHLSIKFNFITILRERTIFDFQIQDSGKDITHKTVQELDHS